MSIIAQVVLFLLGIGVGAFVNSWFWLPMIYGLPKSIYFYAKGRVKFLAIPAQFISPIAIYALLTIALVASNIYLPFVHDQIFFGPAFTSGWLLSLIGMFMNFFSEKGRKDMADDYERWTLMKFKKETSELNDLKL